MRSACKAALSRAADTDEEGEGVSVDLQKLGADL